jgi:hypothetical protein
MNRAHHDLVDPAPLGTAAPPVGLSPPQKVEAQRLAGAAGLEGKTQYDTGDSDAISPSAQLIQAADTQRFARLRANFVTAGWTLVQCETAVAGTALFLASRWGHVRELPSFAAIEAFARQIGAALWSAAPTPSAPRTACCTTAAAVAQAGHQDHV